MRRAMLRGLALGLIVTAGMGCAAPDGPEGSVCASQYVTMRDGVRIAVDLWLPAERAEAAALPAIFIATRYWRGVDLHVAGVADDPAWDMAAWFNPAGYAVVIVDARGTGASFGHRDYPWPDAEVRDYGQVLDWIAAQPWSNGRVGAYGVSYVGTTAELAGLIGHPSVRAVSAGFHVFDVYEDVMHPGGLFNADFIAQWSRQNAQRDANDVCALMDAGPLTCWLTRRAVGGVRPVDGPMGPAWREQAVAAHAENADVYEAAAAVVFKDDPFTTATAERLSPYMRYPGPRADLPVQVWAGWLDAGAADGALKRFMTYGNAQELWLAPWDHGGKRDTDPFNPRDAAPVMTQGEQKDAILAFFDRHLKDGAPLDASVIHYYTMNGGGWAETEVWPPEDVAFEPLFLRAGGGLTVEAPAPGEPATAYAVDRNAGTGPDNRWWSQGGGDVFYGDRRDADSRLAVFTSAPLRADAEITGHPAVVLYLASTAADGALCVYLEAVAPGGRVTYLTEGVLRLVHRRVSAAPPPCAQFGPYRTFYEGDSALLKDGAPTRIELTLEPTSVRIEAGHCLRVAIAGRDADAFPDHVAMSPPVLNIYHDVNYDSHILLPCNGLGL